MKYKIFKCVTSQIRVVLVFAMFIGITLNGLALDSGTRTLTVMSSPSYINPNASVTLNFTTSFTDWNPTCYMAYELVPKEGMIFTNGPYSYLSNFSGDISSVPAALKVTQTGGVNSGTYTLTIADIYALPNVVVSAGDKSKVASMKIVIKSQWSNNGSNDKTVEKSLLIMPSDLGLFGGVYDNSNTTPGAAIGSTWTENWDGGTATTPFYKVTPVLNGTDWVWTFTNVWMKPAALAGSTSDAAYQFRFRFADDVSTSQIGYSDFGSGSRIAISDGVASTNINNLSGNNLGIWNTGGAGRKYNIQVRLSGGLYSLILTNSTPTSTDNLGIIGTAYPIDNVKGAAASTFTGNNWNGSGSAGVINYEVAPTSSGSDVYWYFNDVWIKPNGSFSFWSGRTWNKSLGYANFPSRIFVPHGTTIVQDGSYLKITQTPTTYNGSVQAPAEAQYDIIVKRASNGTFSLYFLYSRLGLNGSCYYKGNRTDAFKNSMWGAGSGNLNWKASTDESYEIGAEPVIGSGTFPACKYRYTYTGVILNRFANNVNQDGIGFVLDNAGWINYKALTGSAAGEFVNGGPYNTNLVPNVYGLSSTTNDAMYTFVFELDYSGASAPADPTVISVQKTVAADWLTYRMGIQGDGYYLENDTTQAGNWSNNWSRADGKTTYDVAPTVSGNNVTWSFNGVILKNGGVFKFRNGSSWNGRNVGYKSLSYYNTSNSFVSTPLTSDVGATYSNPSGTNIAIANPIIHGASSESKYIYKIDLTLDIVTGKYTFLGCNKTTANWLGGNSSWSGADNIETGWRNPLNWDIAVAPLRSTDVVVDKKTYQPIITANASCNTLTIASTAGANVSVNANAVLDVRNIVNSVPSSGVGIILNNNVRKQAILYNYGTYTNAAGGGVIQVNTVLDSDTTYHFGHEVSGAAVLSDNYNAQPISVYRYNTTSNGWDLLANGDKLTTADRTNSFENSSVTGYALRNKSGLTKTLSYSGVPASNSADISTVIPFNSAGTYSYHHGYYLIANPYTTYLNLEALYTAGGFGDANLEKTVWVPHRSKTDATTWEMYNFAGSVGVIGGRVSALTNRNIPPAQAFWVLSKATSSFTFKPSSRTIATGATQQSLKSLSTSSEPNDIFRFGSPSVGLKSQMALLFREIGTAELSSNDSHNFSGLDGIFSMKDGEEIAINLLPMLERDTIIDLGYRYSGSSVAPVVLEAQSLSSFFGSVPVFLEDRDKQMFYDLRETPQVTVYLASGFNSTRFALHFGAYSGLATSKPAITQPTSFIKFYQNNDVVSIAIVGSNDVKGVVQLISVAGEVISTTPISSSTLDVQLPASNMFYIVRVISNVGAKSEKFMVR